MRHSRSDSCANLRFHHIRGESGIRSVEEKGVRYRIFLCYCSSGVHFRSLRAETSPSVTKWVKERSVSHTRVRFESATQLAPRSESE